MEVSSHEDSVGEFYCVGSIFSMKLLGFVSKAMKLLLTELVGQCRIEYISLGLFRIDLPSVGQYGKGCGQYIPALTSHSVNKSILSCRLILFTGKKADEEEVFCIPNTEATASAKINDF